MSKIPERPSLPTPNTLTEKARNFCGKQALSFEASLREEEQRYVWEVKNLEDGISTKIASLLEEGLTQRAIAHETGLGIRD